MDGTFAAALALAYGGTGIIGVVAYWPTIKDLWRGRPSANVLSYFICLPMA